MIYETKMGVIEAKMDNRWVPHFCDGFDSWEPFAIGEGISEALILWGEGELTTDSRRAEEYRQEAEEATGLPCRVAAYKITRAK